MKNFRLKKEAVPFFKEKHATTIQSFDYWEKTGVDMKALDEVEPAYLTYGHKDRNNTGSSLSGWDENGSHFHFTVHFPSATWKENDKFTKGRSVRGMMDRIQREVDRYFSEFVNEEIED